MGNSLKQTPTVTLIHNIVHNNSGIYQLVAATAAYWFHHCCCMKEAGFYKALRVSKHTTDFRRRLYSSRDPFFHLMSTHITSAVCLHMLLNWILHESSLTQSSQKVIRHMLFFLTNSLSFFKKGVLIGVGHYSQSCFE